VLRIEREDFERFADGFAPLRAYFDGKLTPPAEPEPMRAAGE
jgi:hypothetical protein